MPFTSWDEVYFAIGFVAFVLVLCAIPLFKRRQPSGTQSERELVQKLDEKQPKDGGPPTPPTGWDIPIGATGTSDQTAPGVARRQGREAIPTARENPSSIARMQKSQETLLAMKEACESSEEEELYAALSSNRNKVDIQAIQPFLGAKVGECLRDYLALQGEVKLLAELFQVRPDLKTQEFCERMIELYAWLLRDLAQQKAPRTTEFWTEAKTFLES